MSLTNKDISEFEHFDLAENLVDILSTKTQNPDRLFFRVLVAYNLCKIASMMRVDILTQVQGQVPVNMYALNLAPSGAGKGYSTSIMEDNVVNKFQEEFKEAIIPAVSRKSLAHLAVERARKKNTDDELELQKALLEFERLGPILMSFDSGTVPAVKQLRHQLLMAGCGSLNLEIDEIGSNLLGNTEMLVAYLELYDGKIKQKLVKNTSDNLRNEEIDGRTPTNMMLFGTPAKLFNGGKTEEELISFFDTGYARRCIFGLSGIKNPDQEMTAEELYDMQTNFKSSDYLEDLSEHLATLAHMDFFGMQLTMDKEVILLWLEYKILCEKAALELPDHDEIRRAEMSHRFYKTIKIAGAYAFVDGAPEIEMEHLKAAIALVEESGEAFHKIMCRDRPYVKLANYIVDIGSPLTQPDLEEDLPFYRGGQAQRKMLEDLAIADGYRRGMVIKRSWHNGIQFLSGERLIKTDLDKLIVSYSYDITEDYENIEITFDELGDLIEEPALHWVNHHFRDNYRDDEHAIAGFNLIVLDVDDGIPVNVARALFADYQYYLYTTKSHTEDDPCYRIIIPTTHVMKLDEDDYKEFMRNIFDWIPFELDSVVGQRNRKWLTNHKGDVYTNEGELLNVFPFIPDTAKNEEFKAQITKYSNLDNLERWFITSTATGNRNSQLHRYAMILVDAQMDKYEIKDKVIDLNNKLSDKLTKDEIETTIMVSVNKRIKQRGL